MSFRQVDIKLPAEPKCEVVGSLYDSDDFMELGQDMVEVRIPNGITINAGWYPEASVDGQYTIKTWGKMNLPDITSMDVDETAQIIADLVELLTSEEPQAISDANTTQHLQSRYQVA